METRIPRLHDLNTVSRHPQVTAGSRHKLRSRKMTPARIMRETSKDEAKLWTSLGTSEPERESGMQLQKQEAVCE